MKYSKMLVAAAVAVGLGLGSVRTARADEIPEKYRDTVKKGLDWLASKQSDKGSWGQGYGTEATRLVVQHAFATLNLNRVWLEVYEYNPRGLRAYEKVGFRKEGVKRQDNYRAGRYWDTIVMAILREEWDLNQPQV